MKALRAGNGRPPGELVHLEKVWNERNRTPVLLASGSMLVIVALTDWLTTPCWSLGFLYLFPVMLASAFLSRWRILLLAVACVWLSTMFSSLARSPPVWGWKLGL